MSTVGLAQPDGSALPIELLVNPVADGVDLFFFEGMSPSVVVSTAPYPLTIVSASGRKHR